MGYKSGVVVNFSSVYFRMWLNIFIPIKWKTNNQTYYCSDLLWESCGIQPADPGGRGHAGSRRVVLHLTAGVWALERALSHHQPQRHPGTHPTRGHRSTNWKFEKGQREETSTAGKRDTQGVEHCYEWKILTVEPPSGLQCEAGLGKWMLPQPLPGRLLPAYCWRGWGDNGEEGGWERQRYGHLTTNRLCCCWYKPLFREHSLFLCVRWAESRQGENPGSPHRVRLWMPSLHQVWVGAWLKFSPYNKS